MRFVWQPRIPGGSDPEQIWGAVIASSGLIAALWIRSGLPSPLCPLHALTGIPCPTCGTTRSVAALLQGRTHQAFLLNPLSTTLLFGISIYVLYAAVVVALRLPRLRWEPLTATESRWLRIAVIILIASNWAWLIHRGI